MGTCVIYRQPYPYPHRDSKGSLGLGTAWLSMAALEVPDSSDKLLGQRSAQVLFQTAQAHPAEQAPAQ